MWQSIKRFIIGKPLRNEAIHGQKYTVLWGLPILSSDAISSIAYASEEVLIVLVPAIGILSYVGLTYITGAIIGLLLILTFSYRQTIQSYPNGGGAYIVASDNLGKIAGLVAGASLTVDYILTVAVSISSGVAAILSAIPQLLPYRIAICLLILVIIMAGNLRGIKESSRLFSLPTYAFIFAILSMIIAGTVRHFMGIPYIQPSPSQLSAAQPVTLFLVLTAFSNGCAALTGVEAVSNGIPNFREPATKNAKTVLLILSLFVLVLFGGTSILANFYHVVPNPDRTVLSQIARQIFPVSSVMGNFMFYFIQVTTTIILAMAANTSYSDFPLLLSLIAKDGYAPRQLKARGDRLSFSNGIILLSVLAAVLIVVFKGITDALIPLYAIGVFISFTLSQFGMFVRWTRKRESHWHYKALINGLGALVTVIVVVIIAATKFSRGAWIVIIVVPSMIYLMLKVKQHYSSVSYQLKLKFDEISNKNLSEALYRNRVIVPIESVNKASVRALKYALTISDNVTALNVSTNHENAKMIRQEYGMIKTDIPLIIKYSPKRRVIDSLLGYILSVEYNYQDGDIITVLLPQFIIKKWWHGLLHNHSARYIKRKLLKHKHIVIAIMPLQLKDDGFTLKRTSQ